MRPHKVPRWFATPQTRYPRPLKAWPLTKTISVLDTARARARPAASGGEDALTSGDADGAIGIAAPPFLDAMSLSTDVATSSKRSVPPFS